MKGNLFKRLTIIDKILGLRLEKNNISEILQVFFINEIIALLISFLAILPSTKNIGFRYLSAFLVCQFFVGLFIFECFKLKYNNTDLIISVKKANERTYLGKFENRNDGLLWVFEKYFYPKNYKNEFHKIINKKFGNDENLNKFNNWIEKEIITIENLYYLIIEKEDVQKEILNEIEESKKKINENLKSRAELLKEIEKFKISK